MKKYFYLLFSLWIPAANAATPAISVAEFSQEVNHIADGCRGWDFAEQDQLRTELERDLTQHGVKVLNRREIRGIYENEFELPNLDRRRAPKRPPIEKASNDAIEKLATQIAQYIQPNQE